MTVQHFQQVFSTSILWDHTNERNHYKKQNTEQGPKNSILLFGNTLLNMSYSYEQQ